MFLPIPRRATFVAASFAAFGWSSAATPTYSIETHAVVAGSTVTAANSCFRLQASIAEAVAGCSTGAEFALAAGFRSLARDAHDGIYASGFEECAS